MEVGEEVKNEPYAEGWCSSFISVEASLLIFDVGCGLVRTPSALPHLLYSDQRLLAKPREHFFLGMVHGHIRGVFHSVPALVEPSRPMWEPMINRAVPSFRARGLPILSPKSVELGKQVESEINRRWTHNEIPSIHQLQNSVIIGV
jgi:hypothetical protein